MKKKCFAMLMAVAIVVMSIVGCGGSDNKKAAESDKKTTQSNEKKEDKDSKKESQDAGEVVESSDALNVAEDTFQMADLVTKVGGADADMLAFLGAKEAATSYDTKLFGADVKIVVESKDGNVASAQLHSRLLQKILWLMQFQNSLERMVLRKPIRQAGVTKTETLC